MLGDSAGPALALPVTPKLCKAPCCSVHEGPAAGPAATQHLPGVMSGLWMAA